MATWYILRHAEKDKGDFFNSELKHQDPPLSPLGQAHAKELDSYFSAIQITGIYASQYQRTQQTIAYTAREKHLDIKIDSRLNEIDNGSIEGIPDHELQQSYPDVWKAYTERKADFRFPDGETGQEVLGRVRDFLVEKRPLHKDENILLVTHEGIIRMMMCYIVGIPVYKRWNFHVDPCGVMEITYQPDFDNWKLIRFNQKIV